MDKELDDLLDSALNDFDEKLIVKEDVTPLKTVSNKDNNVTIEHTNLYVDDVDYDDRPSRSFTTNPFKSTVTASASSSACAASAPSGPKVNDENMKLFDDIFNDEKTKESMHKFKEAFEMFQSGGDETKLLQNFQKMMHDLVNEDFNFEDDVEVDGENDVDFENEPEFDFLKTVVSPKKDSDANKNKPTNEKLAQSSNPDQNQFNPLKKILEDLNKNSEKVLKSPGGLPFSTEFLSSLTGGLDSDNDDENLDAASSLMMQPVISMLFSKDILYPSLKMMSDNYDKYIQENSSKLSQDQIQKCFEQKECINKMCTIYEAAKDNDSKEAKAEQLKNVLDLLEKCGVSYLNFFAFNSVGIIEN